MQSCNTPVQITNCVIRNNSTAYDKEGCNGGAIFCDTSKAEIVNSQIIGNFGRDGGGLYISHSTVSFNNCLIVKNQAEMYGGGFYIGAIAATNTISFNHCVLSNNTANIGADSTGGGIFIEKTGTVVTATNSIVWQNKPQAFIKTVDITYSFIQEPCAGIGNIIDKPDPLFANVINNDFSLLPGSPCKQTGSDGKDMGIVFAH